MKAIFRTIAIVGAAMGDGLMVGIGQVRKWADPRQQRMVQDGAVAIIITDASGRRVDVLITPEEGMQIGPQIIAASMFAAAAPPPMLTTADVDSPPRIVQ